MPVHFFCILSIIIIKSSALHLQVNLNIKISHQCLHYHVYIHSNHLRANYWVRFPFLSSFFIFFLELLLVFLPTYVICPYHILNLVVDFFSKSPSQAMNGNFFSGNFPPTGLQLRVPLWASYSLDLLHSYHPGTSLLPGLDPLFSRIYVFLFLGLFPLFCWTKSSTSFESI